MNTVLGWVTFIGLKITKTRRELFIIYRIIFKFKRGIFHRIPQKLTAQNKSKCLHTNKVFSNSNKKLRNKMT